ncbi:hypothetical protein G4D82_05485 [Flavobacterium sp. CYK-4]|uniref:histidine kinase n=1 Tax=Flavobacterium lotistagni TaxID=2709660 RepID=UPI00140B82BC|nr:histidine kinase [Flavobacterium lotistagni]NHM06664.1 hypothetical protein [Flavobacterium lotistagni]
MRLAPSYILLFFLIFLFSTSQAQDRRTDSLELVLKNPKLHDTTRLAYIGEVMDMYYTDAEKNYYYLNNLLGKIVLKHYSKKNHSSLHKVYTEWLSSYYCNLAAQCFHSNQQQKALAYHDKAIAVLRQIKSYDEMYVVYLVKASICIRIKKSNLAIPLIFASLKHFEKNPQKNSQQLAYVNSMLAHVYSEQKQYIKAIQYSQQSAHYNDVYYAENPVNHTLYLKALDLIHIAECYWQLKKYHQTISYCQKTTELARKVEAFTIVGLALSKEATAQMSLAHYDLAQKLFQEVLDMKTLSMANDDTAILTSMVGLGQLYYRKQNVALAQVYADKAYAMYHKTADINLKLKMVRLLYDVSLATQNYQKALDAYKQIQTMTDSSRILSAKNALAQQLLQYNYEKKELNLKLEAEKKNNWLIALSGLLLLLILGGVFYYRNSRQKQSIATLEKNQIKQKLLITQMNPHFIFNSVQNIRNLIDNHKNVDAVKYLDQFSVLTRQILENSNENYIALEEEVAMTENYLSIQQLLYNHKFDYTIRVEDNIDPESVFLPPMLTQPFIENAIKHGLSAVSKNGKIDIHFFLDAGKLFFEVTDNGKGFDATKSSSNHKSLAMTITKERLIGYTKNQDFIVQADNLKDQDEKVVGAKVRFEIPYIYEN